MDLLQRFTGHLTNELHITGQDHVLLAISGGLDSTALAHLCHAAGCRFTLAHCNFQLRGEESDRDEAFVRQLATQLQAPLLVKHFDTAAYSEREKMGTQEAARTLRYQWFDELLQTTGCRCLFTAHHRGDNVETVMMNFFRGTGITGLCGIRVKNGAIIRPLLTYSRKELEAYAAGHQLTHVEDSSNASDKYSRNYFRHRVIPAVKEIYPQVEENVAAAIERYREVEMIYQEAVAFKKKKLLVQKGAEWHIPVLKLRQQRPLHTLVFEIVREFGCLPAQVPGVLQLLDAQTGKYIDSGTHRILKNRAWLIIAPLNTAEARHILIAAGERTVVFEHGVLEIAEATPAPGSVITTDANTALVDAAGVNYPLLLRPAKVGDYFYPLGMKKKKKLARFFIDQKLSKTQKEKVWVVESDKKIIWVIGHRIDDRVKITAPGRPGIQFNFRSGTI